jgi:hypothetical protein
MYARDQYSGLGSIHLMDEIRQDISHPLDILKAPAELLRAAYSPLAHTLKQVEIHVIRPYLAPLIKPLAKIAPKITIAGHRYDLGGSQMLQKSATGAVAGFAVGGVYGAVAGAVVAGLIKGKPDVANNLITGLAAGAAAASAASLLSSSSVIPGTGGMTAADMAAAGATPTQIAEITAAASAPGGFAANAALMPSVGTIPGTGMTAGEMAAAGASNADISAAISNAYTEIPGTGMTPSQMMDSGATPQQVSEIQQAANAPGGIGNAANANLMPSVGDSLQSSLVNAANTGKPLTASQIASGVVGGAGIAAKALSIAQLVSGKKSSVAAAETGVADTEESLISNPYIWVLGGAAVFIIGLAIYKRTR